MRKWMITSLFLALFIFLAVRGIMHFFQRGQDERKWYVSQLDFEFSAEIDSIKPHSKFYQFLFFHFTGGGADKSVEYKLNQKVKHNGNLSFFLYRANKPFIIISTEEKYMPGDSLYVNTNQNRIAIYRKGIKVSESEVLTSLNGRPF